MSKNKSTIDLTSGSISLGLVKFALPLMAGNVLQQCYNLTDTLVVGRFIGKNALAAVGSAYTLMIFLTSIILGLSMGCGAFLSIKYGAKEDQEFAIGNAYSAFVAQNCGAQQSDRIKQGNRQASWWILAFCLVISSLVVFWAKPLLALFSSDPEVIQIGIGYLRIEGSFYALIGFLFMFYGYFRAIDEPMISVVLTIFSLGTRVLLAYLLSAVPSIGYIGIWASIPIGWALADLAGLYYLHKKAVKPADCF